MAGCIFCDIVSGTADAAAVFEDELTYAFLDHRPVFHGHCLLLPKVHVETLPQLPSTLLQPLFGNAQILATAVQRALHADGTFVAINNRVSQSVPHLHIHIIPRKVKDGLKGFFWPRHPYRDERHVQETQDRIREALKEIGVG